jgi:hypothetical protein
MDAANSVAFGWSVLCHPRLKVSTQAHANYRRWGVDLGFGDAPGVSQRQLHQSSPSHRPHHEEAHHAAGHRRGMQRHVPAEPQPDQHGHGIESHPAAEAGLG